MCDNDIIYTREFSDRVKEIIRTTNSKTFFESIIEHQYYRDSLKAEVGSQLPGIVKENMPYYVEKNAGNTIKSIIKDDEKVKHMILSTIPEIEAATRTQANQIIRNITTENSYNIVNKQFLDNLTNENNKVLSDAKKHTDRIASLEFKQNILMSMAFGGIIYGIFSKL